MRTKYFPSLPKPNSYNSKSVNQLKQTHTLLLKTLTKTHYHHLLTQFLTQLLQLPGDNLSYARLVFDRIPNCKNQFLWTSLIRSHVLHAHFSQSILLYAKMHRINVSPSGFTFSSVLNASARIPAIFQGKQIHTRVIQSGFLGNKIVQTALLDMYAKCGCVLDARCVFDMMDDKNKDVVAWTAMICGYTKIGMMNDAQRLFENMSERNVVSWSAMVAGYAHCGDMKAARELYDEMLEKNSVTWVAMIAGYGKCGDVNEARRVFDQIEMQDALCWAAMVACYAQNGYAKEAIEMYNAMREQNVRISEVAMVGAISACTQLGDIEMATTLGEHMEEGCCDGWEKSWEQGVTPWDLGQPTPIILHLRQTGALPKGRALVPGCGSGYDVVAMACAERYVVGLDVSDNAIKKALELSSSVPNADYFTFLKEDFFTWCPTELFDLIFDYTFFCAIEPDMRSAWAQQMRDILKPGGELITLMFPIDDHVGGPPYKVSISDYEEVLHPMGFKAISIVDNEMAIGARKGKEKLGRWKRSLSQSLL